MSRILFFTEQTQYVIRNKNLIREWLEKSALKEKRRISDINIIICSDSFLRKINKKYLNHDYFTDIITFPYSLPGSKEISGDIYISIDRVRLNAKDYGVSVYEELLRVLIHGVLHLCGYDDHTPAEKAEMRKREDYYLRRFTNSSLH